MTRAQTFRAIHRAGSELPEIFRATIASGITIPQRIPRLAACRIFTGNQSKNSRKLPFKGKGLPPDKGLE
jgi:hypothetical protein